MFDVDTSGGKGIVMGKQMKSDNLCPLLLADLFQEALKDRMLQGWLALCPPGLVLESCGIGPACIAFELGVEAGLKQALDSGGNDG